MQSEAVRFIGQSVASVRLRTILLNEMSHDLKLKSGNPNPGNLGADFGRLGIDLWPTLEAMDSRNKKRHGKLEELNLWRNAIAHHDFDSPKLKKKTAVQSAKVREWRSVCDALTGDLDEAVGRHLAQLLGASP